MCEHCGCYDSPQIMRLHADHEQILREIALLTESLRAHDVASASERIAHLADVLAQHNARLGLVEPADIVDMCAEHHILDQALSRPVRSIVDVERAALLLTMLRRHIMTEEQDTFPYALQIFSHEDWDAVDQPTGVFSSTTPGSRSG